MRKPARDSGFTLIEVLVTISLMGMIMAFTVGGWGQWARARQQSGTAQELRSVLRSTQQRAVTEGTSMCVSFATTGFRVWRGGCTSGTQILAQRTNGEARLTIPPAFTPVTAAQDPATLVFTARGTASAGEVHVTRPGSSKDYAVKVDGFTGRVTLCDGSVCNGV